MAAEPTYSDSSSTVQEKTLLDYGLEIVTCAGEFGCSRGSEEHRNAPSSCNPETQSVEGRKLQEQAELLEKDLIRKEEETLNVLQQLEGIRKFVEGLKADLLAEPSLSVMEDHPVPDAGSVLADLIRTRSNFNKVSTSLAVIQASLEPLNKKVRLNQLLLPYENNSVDDPQQLMMSNVVAHQVKKMKDASRDEMAKAMREIESSKMCIRMAEMRLNAARKMEEAAMAAEAVAIAERRSLFPRLMDKKEDEKIHPYLGKFLEKKQEGDRDRGIYCRRRAHVEENGWFEPIVIPTGRRDPMEAISVGAILSRKLLLEDVDHEHMTKRRSHHRSSESGPPPHVSLGQMLRRPRILISHLSKPTSSKNMEKAARNKYELIPNPLYSGGGSRAACER